MQSNSHALLAGRMGNISFLCYNYFQIPSISELLIDIPGWVLNYLYISPFNCGLAATIATTIPHWDNKCS